MAIAVLPLVLLAVSCKPPPEQRQFMPIADVEAGRRAIDRVGCAACHSIRGIDWPQGKVGPPLAGFSHRALIAGHAPNTPELLARFVRNAPEVVPNSAMPPMPLTVEESRDVAAYLYQIGGQ